jgi:hypothetical protein
MTAHPRQQSAVVKRKTDHVKGCSARHTAGALVTHTRTTECRPHPSRHVLTKYVSGDPYYAVLGGVEIGIGALDWGS